MRFQPHNHFVEWNWIGIRLSFIYGNRESYSNLNNISNNKMRLSIQTENDWERASHIRNVICNANEINVWFCFPVPMHSLHCNINVVSHLVIQIKFNPFSFCPLTHRQHKFTWIYYDYVDFNAMNDWTNERRMNERKNFVKRIEISLMEFRLLFVDNNIRIGLMYLHSLFHILYYGHRSLFAWMSYIYMNLRLF